MNRIRLGLLLAAGAAGVTLLTAPAALALSESTIKSECAAANGTYTTTVSNGSRFSKCCYKDISGKKWCDVYLDGVYEGTDPAKIQVNPTQPPRQIEGLPTAVLTEPTAVLAP